MKQICNEAAWAAVLVSISEHLSSDDGLLNDDVQPLIADLQAQQVVSNSQAQDLQACFAKIQASYSSLLGSSVSVSIAQCKQ